MLWIEWWILFLGLSVSVSICLSADVNLACQALRQWINFDLVTLTSVEKKVNLTQQTQFSGVSYIQFQILKCQNANSKSTYVLKNIFI